MASNKVNHKIQRRKIMRFKDMRAYQETLEGRVRKQDRQIDHLTERLNQITEEKLELERLIEKMS